MSRRRYPSVYVVHKLSEIHERRIGASKKRSLQNHHAVLPDIGGTSWEGSAWSFYSPSFSGMGTMPFLKFASISWTCSKWIVSLSNSGRTAAIGSRPLSMNPRL